MFVGVVVREAFQKIGRSHLKGDQCSVGTDKQLLKHGFISVNSCTFHYCVLMSHRSCELCGQSFQGPGATPKDLDQANRKCQIPMCTVGVGVLCLTSVLPLLSPTDSFSTGQGKGG